MIAMLDRKIPISILDVSPIVAGGSVAESLQNTLDLAVHAEQWGYHRYWLAEHHNMPSIASSATAVLIGQVAARTNKMRIGSGGIMLPNHAPLAIAEQFGTLEALYPDRIDLGLGRAPGTDPLTAQALRGDRNSHAQQFPAQLADLRRYIEPDKSQYRNSIRAIPGEGANLPIWLLGSSDFSASLAAELGLPFAFAGHFSPTYIVPALRRYKEEYKASEQWPEPYSMLAVNVIAADTDEEAQYLATSLQQLFLSFIRSKPMPVPPPVHNMEQLWTPQEMMLVQQQVGSSIIGSKETIARKLNQLIEATDAEEIMVAAHIYEHKARLRSYEIISELI